MTRLPAERLEQAQQVIPPPQATKPLGRDAAGAKAGPEERPGDRAVGVGVALEAYHALESRAKFAPVVVKLSSRGA